MPPIFQTIVGEYGTSVVELPRPEPKQAPRVRLTLLEVCKQFRWTEEELASASMYAFPRSIGMRPKKGTAELEAIWDAKAVAVWKERFLAFAKSV